MLEESATQTKAARKTTRTGTPVTIGKITLLPIERVVLHSDRRNGRVWFSAAKEPYALIIRDAEGVRTIGNETMAVSLEALREEVPGLNTVLAAM